MLDLLGSLPAVPGRAVLETRAFYALTRSGAVGLPLPHQIVRKLRALHTYGPFGAAVKVAAITRGTSPAIADERGEMTYAELDEAVDRLANAFRERLEPGATVGILCRNHRAPLFVAFAASRAGLNAVWLNTAFSARQCAEVAARERVDLVVHDVDLADVVVDVEAAGGVFTVDITQPSDALDELIASGSLKAPPAPDRPGRIILLTSGTTGTPKGAPRSEPRGLVVPGSLLERMPMRTREATVIGPPLFHGTGLLLAMITIALGNKLVLRRAFDAATLLDDIEQHGATTVCLVPIMLQRVLALGPDEVGARDISTLRVVFCAGSQLPAAVATEAQRVFGDVIYNLYGSTEVAIATIATPQDVHEAPTSVGRPVLGTRIRVIGEHGQDVPVGVTGRVFVGTTTPFEGYTGGGTKEIVDGLMATGDVGHFDESGRLYVDGRDDDMIVSGGENVFPAEVEELLVAHDCVLEVVVIGVPDEDFGQRLAAYVVSSADVTAEDLKEYVKANLARYKVPRDVVFLDELPRNPMGKVLKNNLGQDRP